MYWEEDKDNEPPEVDDAVVDLVFGIDCRCLPVDHAYDLSQAIQHVLPWLPNEPSVGMHTIHGAASGNGWVRPQGPDDLLQLSRRTKFTLRVPKHRIEDTMELQGKTLDVGGYPLVLKSATQRPLSVLTTLFARYLATEHDLENEEQLLDWVARRLQQLNIQPRKLLCGTLHLIKTPAGDVQTRSLMIADLDYDGSLQLQKQGLGPHRMLGCGLFIPHKGIQALDLD
ncbi:MAG TPA: type I-MYXAN CRISPR-associated protein Cas6/Cmx6 [Chromatiales bacterium]|nr:type I-MYXAN CRISPR-associated protein Cas6/Cmx6 [Chromatiales bacterium]HEX21883.1 type I-MYXAN CRISPR-associated protein Cas6/Cmx6 [Chromatiales bacterium]